MKHEQPTRKIRYAVAGLGYIAQTAVLPAFQHAENSELVALISNDPEKRERLARKYHVDKTYSYDEYEDCLASGIDAVYIALPNHLHMDFSVRAAQAGVHVLCEKPMAVNEVECETMIESADSNKVKLMIAYRLHFEKGNLSAIETARSGKLGELRIFSSEFTQQVAEGNVRLAHDSTQGGGSVFDMGVYCINAARYLFGADPVAVTAFSTRKPEDRFRYCDEMTSAVLRFPGHCLATFTSSFGAAPLARYTLIGTKGTLTADPAYEYEEAIKYELVIDGKRTRRTFAHRDQFAAELVYFSDCILQDLEPEPSGLEGLADVLITKAIYRSAQLGQPITLQALPHKKRPTLAQEISRPSAKAPKPIHAKSPSGEAA